MSRIIIVGAGAAGLMAAIHAARAGAGVTVLEQNEKAGKKIYITGKGRCNCTHDCTIEDFLREVPRNPRFLYSALNFFSPQDLMALLSESGCPVTVQRGQRVFPASEKASDVTRTLLTCCRNAGAAIQLHQRVGKILTEEGRIAGVRLDSGETLPADAVMLNRRSISSAQISAQSLPSASAVNISFVISGMPLILRVPSAALFSPIRLSE